MYILTHTRWNWMYHFMFIPKYRGAVLQGALRADTEVYQRTIGREQKT
jgi:REP element-mobilizing transposase RayT